MAEFCKYCLEREMGIKLTDKLSKGWLVKNNGICEGCGYEYLKKEKYKKQIYYDEPPSDVVDEIKKRLNKKLKEWESLKHGKKN